MIYWIKSFAKFHEFGREGEGEEDSWYYGTILEMSYYIAKKNRGQNILPDCKTNWNKILIIID